MFSPMESKNITDSQAVGPSTADTALASAGPPKGQTAHRLSDQAQHAAGYQVMAMGLKKTYYRGRVAVPVLRGVNLAVREGEFLAIVGQSGSGKTTLLHLLGTLDEPDDGAIYFQRRRIDHLPTTARDRLRNQSFGMIFQMYHLLPELSTLENVMLPLLIGRRITELVWNRRRYRRRATELLEAVGLAHRVAHRPRELSGGEMQRAAIARALVMNPKLLLADEPTGNLDRSTGQEILALLRSLNRGQKLTIVMVTHDPEVARQADRIVRLVDGRIEHTSP